MLVARDRRQRLPATWIVLFRAGSSGGPALFARRRSGHARQGLGRALLEAAERGAGERGATRLRLEVREDNFARSSLRAHGLSRFGAKPDYYAGRRDRAAVREVALATLAPAGAA